jgi:hypothetical protein
MLEDESAFGGYWRNIAISPGIKPLKAAFLGPGIAGKL